LVLATTPITIATERNNTIDGMLIFTLLSATWAVWRSVESGKFRYVLLGALLVGLGFNIKMLQAYMILPALYALYFLGAKHGWWKRIVHLSIATFLMLIVSLSWALIVDSVPATSRPFIGSSSNHSMMELIVGHNGADRFAASQSNQANLPNTQNEVGPAGIFRLFTEPLASQISWLLPLTLMGWVLGLVFIGFSQPLDNKHLALILWISWLLPMSLYFMFSNGVWHTYYLIMLGPALAALVGVAMWVLDQSRQKSHTLGWILGFIFSGITIGFEIFILSFYPAYFYSTSLLMGFL